MPIRYRVAKRLIGPSAPLSFDQDFALRTGRREAWDSEREARAAWDAHREEMIESDVRVRPGLRPWAFWAYDVARPELLEDRGEINPDDFEDPDERITVPNENGTVRMALRRDGHEHTGWCYDRARALRLHARRLEFLRLEGWLLPGEHPEQAHGPDWPILLHTP